MPRRSKVDTSKHKEEIEHLLIEQRWGSRTTARYLELRYGEVIPPSTLRTWRTRKLALLTRQGKLPECWSMPPETDQSAPAKVRRLATPADALPDVVGRRIALIQMQEARITIDMEHEVAMGKLFVSQAKEIELLNKLYNDLRMDLQEYGMFPRSDGVPATQIQVNAFGGAAEARALAATGTDQPRGGRPLGELMPGATDDERKQLARSLVLLRRNPPDVDA